jgi:hypothetical protein
MDPSRTKPGLAQRIQQAPIVYLIPPPPSLKSYSNTGFNSSVAAPRAPKNINSRGRGNRRGGRSGPSGGGRRPKKTVDELDAEMTDYFDNNAATANNA